MFEHEIISDELEKGRIKNEEMFEKKILVINIKKATSLLRWWKRFYSCIFGRKFFFKINTLRTRKNKQKFIWKKKKKPEIIRMNYIFWKFEIFFKWVWNFKSKLSQTLSELIRFLMAFKNLLTIVNLSELIRFLMAFKNLVTIVFKYFFL